MLVLKTKYQKLSRVAFAPDGRGLAAAGQHGAYWWRSVFDDPKAVRFGEKECGGVGFTPDGAYLICAIDDLGLAAIHLASGACKFDTRIVWRPEVAVCPATGLAVVGKWPESQVTGFRIGADDVPAPVWSVDAAPGSLGSSIAFAPDGAWFVRAARDPARTNFYRLVLHDPATGKEIGSCRGSAWVSAGPAVSPDRRRIAYANANQLLVQSVDETSRDWSVNENTHQYTGMAFHPSGRFLAATNNDKTVKLYESDGLQLARTFTWDIGKMRSVCFSPDGTLAAAGSDSGKVVVWDVDV